MTLKDFCFSFKGRINRTMYWIYVPIGLLASGGIGLLSIGLLYLSEYLAAEHGEHAPADLYLIAVPLFIVKTIIDLAVSVKRLHDSNRQGSMLFMGLIPVIGLIYLLVVCGFIAGTKGDNEYGPPPVDKLT